MKMLLTAVLAGAMVMTPALAAEKVTVDNQQVVPLTVNINSADVGQLTQLKGIGESKAIAIIEYRNTNGKFASIDELSNVKGIGTKLLEQNRANLSL
ncbi:helix-hairpin-helix domain-containing protein [Shewanella sp. Isolate11]|uniref:ComEA family DNA-binding protein n=1 Tax=Shewanella sp. Isolate11 TaxID=2908530 RepID=UPI001EFCF818|nr:helix-hairpin-helix domain-containing protein [Shewanella sp. Isolate11]MCG9696242.1 helix-hairpin-helix domain-containing protein [Shewanella sp. Isolate11]